MRIANQILGLIASTAALILITGCQSLGPTSVRASRPEYNAAILETAEEVMMLNFVRIRYSESPLLHGGDERIHLAIVHGFPPRPVSPPAAVSTPAVM